MSRIAKDPYQLPSDLIGRYYVPCQSKGCRKYHTFVAPGRRCHACGVTAPGKLGDDVRRAAIFHFKVGFGMLRDRPLGGTHNPNADHANLMRYYAFLAPRTCPTCQATFNSINGANTHIRRCKAKTTTTNTTQATYVETEQTEPNETQPYSGTRDNK